MLRGEFLLTGSIVAPELECGRLAFRCVRPCDRSRERRAQFACPRQVDPAGRVLGGQPIIGGHRLAGSLSRHRARIRLRSACLAGFVARGPQVSAGLIVWPARMFRRAQHVPAAPGRPLARAAASCATPPRVRRGVAQAGRLAGRRASPRATRKSRAESVCVRERASCVRAGLARAIERTISARFVVGGSVVRFGASASSAASSSSSQPASQPERPAKNAE